MMDKKSRTIILFLPLGILVVLNMAFILSQLGGKEDYLRIAQRIILNDFYGLHSVAFAVVLAVLGALSLGRKISGVTFLRRALLAFLLFMIAVNLSFFPELNRDARGQELMRFRRLETPYLEEAIRTSPAKSAEAIERYLQLGSDLKGKTLIIPWQSGDEGLISLIGFVDLKGVVRKKYSYLIGASDLEFLKALDVRTSRFSIKDRKTESIIIINEEPDAKTLTLFRQDRTVYFFSPEIVKRLSVKLHD